MLNFLLSKTAIALAIVHASLYTTFSDRSKKLHIDYGLDGVASVRAVDKLELNSQDYKTFYQSPVTQHLSTNVGLQERLGTVKPSESFIEGVDLTTFKATLPSGVFMTRDEYHLSRCHGQSDFRVALPNGTLIGREDYDSFVQRNQHARSLGKPLPYTVTLDQEDVDAADNENFAIPV